MGFFLSKYFQEDLGFPFVGILGETWSAGFIRFIKGESAETWIADYVFTGKVIFRKDAFRTQATREVPIIIPLAPGEVYRLSLNKKGRSTCVGQGRCCSRKRRFLV